MPLQNSHIGNILKTDYSILKQSKLDNQSHVYCTSPRTLIDVMAWWRPGLTWRPFGQNAVSGSYHYRAQPSMFYSVRIIWFDNFVCQIKHDDKGYDINRWGTTVSAVYDRYREESLNEIVENTMHFLHVHLYFQSKSRMFPDQANFLTQAHT